MLTKLLRSIVGLLHLHEWSGWRIEGVGVKELGIHRYCRKCNKLQSRKVWK